MRPLRYFEMASNFPPLHTMYPTPLALPVGTTPQPVDTISVAQLIQDSLAHYSANSKNPLPIARDTNGRRRLWLALHLHFTRPSNAGSTNIYTNFGGIRTLSLSTGSNLSLTHLSFWAFPEDTSTATLSLSQGTNVGWTLAGYTLYAIPHALFLDAAPAGGTVRFDGPTWQMLTRAQLRSRTFDYFAPTGNPRLFQLPSGMSYDSYNLPLSIYSVTEFGSSPLAGLSAYIQLSTTTFYITSTPAFLILSTSTAYDSGIISSSTSSTTWYGIRRYPTFAFYYRLERSTLVWP